MKRIVMVTLCILLLFGLPIWIFAQSSDTNSSYKFELGGSCSFWYGKYHSSVPQILPENWQERYQPGGDMATKQDNSASAKSLGITLEPTLVTKSNWRLGIPISYHYPANQQIARTIGYWWDPVPVLQVEIRKPIPSLGISVQKKRLKIQYSVQPYRIVIEEFKGVDVWGGKNYAELQATHEFSKGWGQRIEIFWFTQFEEIVNDESEYGYPYSYGKKKSTKEKEQDRIPGVSWGFFYERDGSQVWSMGISYNLVGSLN